MLEKVKLALRIKTDEYNIELNDLIDAIAALGDSARNNVLIASGSTLASIRKAALQANFAYDPFQGLTVISKDGMTGAIVGDLAGVQANLPEGDAVTFKFDDLSLAESDLVKVVGREYAGHGITKPGRFCKLTKAAAQS